MLLSDTASGVGSLLMSLLSVSRLKSGGCLASAHLAGIRRCMVIYRDAGDVEIVEALGDLS